MPDAVQTMFSVREVPWHGKGKIVDNALTAEEAIVQAGLDWKVALHEVCLAGEPVPDMYLVVRQDVFNAAGSVQEAVENGAVLGNVGSRYHPVQNRDLFRFFDPVVDPNEGAFYHTGGALKGGKVVWFLAKVPGDFYIVDDDKVENYLLLASSHDGSLPVLAKHTPVRVVCANTLAMSLNIKSTEVRIPHTESAEARLAVAHTVLGLATKRVELVQAAAEHLLSYQVGQKVLGRFLKRLMPSKPELEGEDVSARTAKQREMIEILFMGTETNTLPGMEGTGWALYNAVTEYADHHKPAQAATDKLHRMWFGGAEGLKLRAFNLLTKNDQEDW